MSGRHPPSATSTTGDLPELFQNFSLQDRQLQPQPQPQQLYPQQQPRTSLYHTTLAQQQQQQTCAVDETSSSNRQLIMEEVLITKLTSGLETQGGNSNSCGSSSSSSSSSSGDGTIVMKLTLLLDVKNEWGTGGLGGVLFPSAREFIRFFSQSQFHGYFEGKRVLELGSGVGAVGMTILLLGAQHVSLTDLDAMLPLLHLNFKYNFNACAQPIIPVTIGHSYLHSHATCPYHLHSSTSFSSAAASNISSVTSTTTTKSNCNHQQSVSILPLRWGSVVQPWGSYDFIIGSDVVYDLDGFHHLLVTMRQFSYPCTLR